MIAERINVTPDELEFLGSIVERLQQIRAETADDDTKAVLANDLREYECRLDELAEICGVNLYREENEMIPLDTLVYKEQLEPTHCYKWGGTGSDDAIRNEVMIWEENLKHRERMLDDIETIWRGINRDAIDSVHTINASEYSTNAKNFRFLATMVADGLRTPISCSRSTQKSLRQLLTLHGDHDIAQHIQWKDGKMWLDIPAGKIVIK